MKIAILGSTGMLGSMLATYLGDCYELKPISHKDFDAEDATVPELKSLLEGCDWVINAIGAIPQRVKNYDKMMAINGAFPSVLCQLAGPRKRMIQIATDCAYSGIMGNYHEKDKLDAIDTYGKSKIMGEVTHTYFHHLRCSIVGPETHGQSLLGWFLGQPKGAEVLGYMNNYWNGITTLHFAKICHGIIDRRIPLGHIQHIVPFDQVSKYELLGYFATFFNRTDIIIKPTNTIQLTNRTLNTVDRETNLKLWNAAGYRYPPTINQMIKELAEYV